MIYTDVGGLLPGAIKNAAKKPKAFENYRTNVSTTMGFLLGMSDESLANSPDIMKPEIVANLKKNADACIIRSLCSLRKSFLCFYEKIKAERYKLRPIEDMTEYLNVSDIIYLRGQGIEVAFVNVKNCNEPAI
ncbi:MAG: hypothetical protein LUD47_08070, partial [Clostridia bacterium]|nr:hypothetical protein [Clostridia bacterium]